jgi:hypothetical protein
MRRNLWLSLAFATVVGITGYNFAHAAPANPQPLGAAADTAASSDVQLARYYGRGRWRVGGRYYGGVWYGTGRRFWNGRWYAYGVGSCWRMSPIGYVWVC